MTARITFRSEMYIEGNSIEEIMEKFDSFPIFSVDALEDASAEYIELVSVEDAETKKSLI